MDSRTELRFKHIEDEKLILEAEITRLRYRYERLCNEQQRILNWKFRKAA